MSKAALQSALLRMWTQRGPIARLLWPLSQIYRCLTALRSKLYQWGWLETHHVEALVLVVGNVIAGGAGKTPTVMAIAQHLRAQGYLVGVISRGFGRSNTQCLEVHPESRPQDVGDEPLLIHRSARVPVFVGRTRHTAATALIEKYPQTEILICDDGLQHYGLYRDVEVCVFDDRGYGNGWLLPAGPLRQSWPRQPLDCVGQRDDHFLVLHTGSRPAFSGFTAERTLASYGVRHDGTTVHLSELDTHTTKPLAAVAGIAQPESFFAMLRALQLPLARTVGLPDHYDFDSLPRSIYEGYSLICTEKDAVKLWQLASDAMAVPLVLTIEPAFFIAFDACIKAALFAKLSSPHGHKTS